MYNLHIKMQKAFYDVQGDWSDKQNVKSSYWANWCKVYVKGEVGLFIGEEENRSKGYGTEALSLHVEYGFNYLNLKNIMLKVFSFNKRAIKSYEKIGFKVFGKRTEDYYLNGKWYDEYFMEILRKEK